MGPRGWARFRFVYSERSRRSRWAKVNSRRRFPSVCSFTFDDGRQAVVTVFGPKSIGFDGRIGLAPTDREGCPVLPGRSTDRLVTQLRRALRRRPILPVIQRLGTFSRPLGFNSQYVIPSARTGQESNLKQSMARDIS